MNTLTADEVLELHHHLDDLDNRELHIPYTEFKEQVDSAFEIPVHEIDMDIWLASWNLLLRIGAEEPFMDGNKRTAWQSIVKLLEKNGYSLDAKQTDCSAEFCPLVFDTLNKEYESMEDERQHFINDLKEMVHGNS